MPNHMQARQCSLGISGGNCTYLWSMAWSHMTLSSINMLVAITMSSAGKLLGAPDASIARC